MITLDSPKVKLLLEDGLGLRPEIKEWVPLVRLLSHVATEFGGDDTFCSPGCWKDICEDLKLLRQVSSSGIFSCTRFAAVHEKSAPLKHTFSNAVDVDIVEAYNYLRWIYVLGWYRDTQSPHSNKTDALKISRAGNQISSDPENSPAAKLMRKLATFVSAEKNGSRVERYRNAVRHVYTEFTTRGEKSDLLATIYKLSFPSERSPSQNGTPEGGVGSPSPIIDIVPRPRERASKKGGGRKMALVRLPNPTPFNSTFWNPIEKREFLKGVTDGLDSSVDSQSYNTYLLLLLCYQYGRPIEHWFSVNLGDIDSIDASGYFLLPILLPDDIYKPDDRTDWIVPESDVRLTPCAVLIHYWKKVNLTRGASVGDALGLHKAQVEKNIKKFLRHFSVRGMPSLSLTYVIKQRKLHTWILSESPLMTYLSIGEKDVAAPTGIYYQCVAATTIQSLHDIASKWMFDSNVDVNYQSYISTYLQLRVGGGDAAFVGWMLDQSRLASVSEQLFAAYAQANSLVDQHNRLVDYIVAMLMLGLGVRPVRDPFPYKWWFNLPDKLALLQDKSVGGEPNYRIVPLPKLIVDQIAAYEKHLKGLASKLHRLGSEFDAVSISILALAKGRPTSQALPYFFYLDKGGRKLRSIHAGDVRRLFNLDAEAPVNLGRKWLHKTLSEGGVPDLVIRSIFGHMSVSENLLSKSSITGLVEAYLGVPEIVDAGLRNLHWRLITGVRRYGLSDLSVKRMASGGKAIFPAALLGPERRMLAAKKGYAVAKQKLKVLERQMASDWGRDASSLVDTGDYSVDEARIVFRYLNEMRDSESNRNERCRISKMIHVFTDKIRSRFGGTREFREICSVRGFTAERNRIRPSHFTKYAEATCVRRQLLMYFHSSGSFSNEGPPESSKQIAEIVLTAGLMSYVQDTTALEKLAVVDRVRQTHYGPVPVLTLDSDIPNYPFLRWIPDAISSSLIQKADQLLSVPASRTCVENALQTIFVEIGGSLSASGIYDSISKLARSLALFELPGAWQTVLSYPSGVKRVHSTAFDKKISGFVPNRVPIELVTPVVESKLSTVSGGQPQRHIAYQAIREVLSVDYDMENNADLRPREKCLALLAEGLRGASDIWASQGEVPKKIGEWLLDMSMNGTVEKRYPALGTLRRYYSVVTNAVFALGTNIDLLDQDEGEFTDLYSKLRRSSNEADIKLFWTAIRQFHDFLIRYYDAPHLNWRAIDDVGGQVSAIDSCSNDYVTIPEYLACLNEIVSSAQLNEDQKLDLGATLFLSRRFGLRSAETRMVCLRDIVFCESSSLLWVRLPFMVKRTAQRRQVQLIGKLNAIERQLLLSLLDRARQASGIIGKTRLIRLKVDDKERSHGDLRLLIKFVCGSRSANLRTLRHSWCSDRCIDFLLSKAAPSNVDVHNAYLMQNSSALLSVSMSMGHTGTKTAIQTYFNFPEFTGLNYPNRASLQEPSLRACAYITGRQYNSLRRSQGFPAGKLTRHLEASEVWALASEDSVVAVPPGFKFRVGMVSSYNSEMLLRSLLQTQILTKYNDIAIVHDDTLRILNGKALIGDMQRLAGKSLFKLSEYDPDFSISRPEQAWLRNAISEFSAQLDASDIPRFQQLAEKYWLYFFGRQLPCASELQLRQFAELWAKIRPAGYVLRLCYTQEAIADVKGWKYLRLGFGADCERVNAIWRGDLVYQVWLNIEQSTGRSDRSRKLDRYLAIVLCYFRQIH